MVEAGCGIVTANDSKPENALNDTINHVVIANGTEACKRAMEEEKKSYREKQKLKGIL